MTHDTDLITTLAVGLGLAFMFGMIAQRMRLPPLVGYLVAGVAIGPFTPGLVADMGIASELAEVGVILLMFGVGLHFSIKDLLSVKNIAVPGAIGQIAFATLLGVGLSHFWGWSFGAGLVFGLTLSVASTVVLLRALGERGIIDSVDGRISVGWLIVEDLVMVLALVLLPALAHPLGADAAAGPVGLPALAMTILWTLGKVALFVAIMLAVGARVVPLLLDRVASTGSRELFTLAVLSASLGVAYLAATLFDVSFALGAFFAGVVVSGSHLSHHVAEEAMPLQDAFAVLFFVSVGMLFDPRAVIQAPVALLATLAIVLVAKSIAAFAIVWFFRYSMRTALTVSASLAQIGEFSFILAGLGLTLGLLPPEGRNLVLAGAIISITLNPFFFALSDRAYGWLAARPELLARLERRVKAPAVIAPVGATGLRGHAIVVGYGRVGAEVAGTLHAAGMPVIAIERHQVPAEDLRRHGIEVIEGDAARSAVLARAALPHARLMVVAIPAPMEARTIIAQARVANPDLCIVARTHTPEERSFLEAHGADRVVYAETELARAMVRYALDAAGHAPPAAAGLYDPDRPVEMTERGPGL